MARPTRRRFLQAGCTSWTALVLVGLVAAVGRGEPAYRRFLELVASPWAIALHVLVLAALLFHTVTWLNLAPQAMVVKLRGRRLPDAAVVAAHYGAWLALSAAIVFLVVGA